MARKILLVVGVVLAFAFVMGVLAMADDRIAHQQIAMQEYGSMAPRGIQH